MGMMWVTEYLVFRSARYAASVLRTVCGSVPKGVHEGRLGGGQVADVKSPSASTSMPITNASLPSLTIRRASAGDFAISIQSFRALANSLAALSSASMTDRSLLGFVLVS